VRLLEGYHSGTMTRRVPALDWLVPEALVDQGIREGAVFMPFHSVEAAANELTHAAVDAVAKIPEYKVCAVALEALGP
jgi:predicted molibdopterin-dependent oxidoreductase YjgC